MPAKQNQGREPNAGPGGGRSEVDLVWDVVSERAVTINVAILASIVAITVLALALILGAAGVGIAVGVAGAGTGVRRLVRRRQTT